jgi:Cupin
MRLNAGGVRESHWHKAAEWAYMLYGTARITAIQGRHSSTTSESAISGISPPASEAGGGLFCTRTVIAPPLGKLKLTDRRTPDW